MSDPGGEMVALDVTRALQLQKDRWAGAGAIAQEGQNALIGVQPLLRSMYEMHAPWQQVHEALKSSAPDHLLSSQERWACFKPIFTAYAAAVPVKPVEWQTLYQQCQDPVRTEFPADAMKHLEGGLHDLLQQGSDNSTRVLLLGENTTSIMRDMCFQLAREDTTAGMLRGMIDANETRKNHNFAVDFNRGQETITQDALLEAAWDRLRSPESSHVPWSALTPTQQAFVRDSINQQGPRAWATQFVDRHSEGFEDVHVKKGQTLAFHVDKRGYLCLKVSTAFEKLARDEYGGSVDDPDGKPLKKDVGMVIANINMPPKVHSWADIEATVTYPQSKRGVFCDPFTRSAHVNLAPELQEAMQHSIVDHSNKRPEEAAHASVEKNVREGNPSRAVTLLKGIQQDHAHDTQTQVIQQFGRALGDNDRDKVKKIVSQLKSAYKKNEYSSKDIAQIVHQSALAIEKAPIKDKDKLLAPLHKILEAQHPGDVGNMGKENKNLLSLAKKIYTTSLEQQTTSMMPQPTQKAERVR